MAVKVRDPARALLLAEYDLFGGTRTYAKQLVAFYARNHFDLTMLGKGPADDEDMALHCRLHGVRFLRHEEVAIGDSSCAPMPWRLSRERRTLDAFIAEYCPDLIVASVGTPGLFLGHMGRGRRSVYILHTYPEHAKAKWRRLISKLIWAAAVPGDIHFVTVSKYARSRMLDAWGLWRRRSDVSVIYSSVGDVPLNPEVRYDCTHVLTVGHVVEYKNPMLWIETAARVLQELPALKFSWVGPGSLIEQCRRRVADLGLQEKIEFVGPSSDLRKCYEKCDIYVQPSKIESLGLSVLDAMRYGKPCVVANMGGLPELVRNGDSGWVVDVNDGAELARRVIQLAKNPIERERMGRSAQTIYATHFSPDRWEVEMRRLHDSVLA
jgi:glycosyltransferase involved in cell wall biosynthesis